MATYKHSFLFFDTVFFWGIDIFGLRFALVLIALSILFGNANACFLGIIDCDTPTFIIIESDLNISDLGDVTVTSPINDQILVFNSTTLQWENQNQTAAAGSRTYTGIAPITIDNDSNQIGLNVTPTDDWNGTFDDLNSDEFGRLAFDNNFTADNNFSRLQVDNFFGDISGATGYTLDQAYDAESGERVINVDDGDINFNMVGNDMIFDLDESSSFRVSAPASGGIGGLIVNGSGVQNDVRIPFQSVQGVNEVNISDNSAYEINLDTIGGGASFSVTVEDVLVFFIGATPAQIGGPGSEERFFVSTEGWAPLDDANQDLGLFDLRWRDLYLSGTIKGQGSQAVQAFTFDLNGASGDFDTVGDLNSLDLLVRGDVNNNGSTSDANFNRVEADFYFGNGESLTGVLSEGDGNTLYVRLNPIAGQVISGEFDLNHLDGHSFFGHTIFMGDDDDEVVLIQAAAGQTEHVFSITGPEGQHILTILPDGETDLNFVGSQDEGHALHIDVDANGFGNIAGLEIDYVSGDLGLEEEVQVILIAIDQNLTASGQIDGIQIVATEGDANIHFAEIGILIDPITQLSGVFGDMDSAFVAGVDRRAEFISDASNIAIFVNDDDNVLIGNASQFAEIEFLLETTASGAGIKPVFEHSNGVGTFSQFTPTDTTEGMRKTGVIVYDLELIPDWTVGANNEFLIRITRTRNSLTTVPVESLVQIAVAEEFFWNKEGSLFVNDLNVSKSFGMASVVTDFLRQGEIVFRLVDVSTAVNMISISNAATGVGPAIITSGDDADIDLRINPKGAGAILLNASTRINFRDVQGIFSPATGQTTFDMNALFLGDLNNFLGQGNFFDFNIGNRLINNSNSYSIDVDLNANTQTVCAGDTNSVLTSQGLCQSIFAFDVSGGGAADVNGTDIAPNFITTTTDINSGRDINASRNFNAIDGNYHIDGNGYYLIDGNFGILVTPDGNFNFGNIKHLLG